MRASDKTRRWISGLLCLTLQGLAIAQTDNSPVPAPVKPAQVARKPKHSATSHTSSTRTSSSHSTSKRNASHATGKKVAAKRGQQGIDSARAKEIQTALIQQKYMQGEASGSWDSATQNAMRRYQSDHGWQSKTIPDSRALIKLGLGPSSEHLLNPESAMTALPPVSDPKNAAQRTPADQDLPKR
jgi:peptidoglycan hydrolase-like protein with peptidoglycan-binding domain